MAVDVTAGFDKEWIAAVKDIVRGLKADGIHYSDRGEIINRSVLIWEKYMISKGHHGPKFATLSVELKVHFTMTVKSRWDYRVFYIGILMGLTENPNEIN